MNFEENFVCSKTHFLYFGPPCEDGTRGAKEAEGGIGHLAEDIGPTLATMSYLFGLN